MAQSVRRPEVLGALEHKLQRDKNRTSYFGNVKTRLGSKLPAGVRQPPEFTKDPYRSTQQQVHAVNDATDNCAIHHHPNAGCTVNRVPHIRNPKLRQYYLQGISLEQNNVTAKPGYENGQQNDKPSREGLPADTVFSISSHLKNSSTSADKTQVNQEPSSSSHVSTLSSTLIPRQQLRVPRENKTFSSQGSSLSELNPDPDPELRLQPQLASADPGCSHSPSPDAEYDKLLDVEAVPMPDGQTCLLALPPECTEGEGPTVMPYLKLFCRYITDRKGVVSGVLLVTSNKIFFDPCKTHPLVMEHGCEEYLLSCSIDCLASVTFFSDITHVHFNPSQLRWKGPKSVQKSKAECLQGGSSKHEAEAVPVLVSAAESELQSTPALSLSREVSEERTETRDMAETERQLDSGLPEEEGAQSAGTGTLGVAVLSSAASFCCGGQDVGSKVKIELMHTDKTEKGSSVKDQTAVPQRLPSCCPGDLMFIRLRVHQAAGKKKTIAGLRLGSAKTLPRRDSWVALSQESSDELYAYLAHWRPDVCILEGGETGGDGDEEEFVVIEDREEEADKEEEVFQSHWCSGDEWEMVSVEESLAKPTVVIDRDPEGLGEIVAQSRILEASLIREICAELPPRTIGHTWHLSYSTSCHGSSLKTLYRNLSNTDSPALIVIRDALDQVFGSFLSHPLRISETFYGTGETFLFMLHPRFKCFRWTGENSFFIKGDLDSFAVGGGSGHFGLWLDETLYLGRSSPCYTFNNCCLSETDDFRVMELEVWTFR